jgi:hypothetical protein
VRHFDDNCTRKTMALHWLGTQLPPFFAGVVGRQRSTGRRFLTSSARIRNAANRLVNAGNRLFGPSLFPPV